MERMPIDTPQRKIGSKARAIVHYKFDAEHWEYKEETGGDCGRDCIIELSVLNKWKNDKIEGQIKGTEKISYLSNGDVSFPIETKTLNYALRASNSFVLFLVDVKSEIIYYVALQEYFIANGIPVDKLDTQKTLTIHISRTNTVSEADEDLQEIAKSRYVFDEPDNLRKSK